VGKKPLCVKAVQAVADYLASLKSDSPLREMIGNALDVLRENMFAGDSVEKKKFPKIYILKYDITSLYKYNLDKSHRLTYALVADELGTSVVVLEIMNHKEYEKRFGYR